MKVLWFEITNLHSKSDFLDSVGPLERLNQQTDIETRISRNVVSEKLKPYKQSSRHTCNESENDMMESAPIAQSRKTI